MVIILMQRIFNAADQPPSGRRANGLNSKKRLLDFRLCGGGGDVELMTTTTARSSNEVICLGPLARES